jgi:hypothetical protein
MLHRGTFFRDTEARGIVDATSDIARKDPRRALRFEIAGDFKAGESELRILDSRGNLSGVITNLKSDVLLPVTIDVPGKTFRLEVSDRSMTRWIAFLEPVEIGPLSRMTLKVLPWGTRCQYWGWTLLAILGVYRAATWRRRSRAG